ncbi:MAG TPA: HAD family hydrolase [Terriglobia bacterium]|nr:HAD family hydrolase [Terriglobia bacterium]
MNLVVFDLDGTLARTSAVDELCFVQAFADVLGVHNLSTNWLDYDHATDSAVAREVFSRKSGRDPEEWETSRVIDRFVELLNEHHSRDENLFAEIPGASALLLRLQEDSGWGVALATGGWKRSAEFKIRSAGLALARIPAAFSEDGPSREKIVRTAIARASAWYAEKEFERIVSVGDAVWDIQTARELHLPFLGVAEGSRAMELHNNGARHVTGNFLDQSQWLRWLNEYDG